MNSLERIRDSSTEDQHGLPTSAVASRYGLAPEPTMMVKGLGLQIKMVSGRVVSGEW